MKNSEGYSDPTAGTAIKNIMREQHQAKKSKRRRKRNKKRRRNRDGCK